MKSVQVYLTSVLSCSSDSIAMSDREIGMDIVKLDGTNYSTWKFEISIALEAKDLLGYVDGTLVKPDDGRAAELKVHGQRSAQVKMVILSTITQNLRRNLYNCRTAKEMWEKLQDLYGDASEDAVQTAWEQFYNFRISEEETIAAQLETLEGICRRLQEAGEEPSDKAIMTKLLRSLPAKFSIFRHTWECTPAAEKTKPNLIRRLIKEDRWLAEDEVSTLALHVQKTSLKNDASKKKRSKKDIEELKKRTRCGVCKEKGHWARECPNKPGTSVKHAPAFVCDVVATYKCTDALDKDVWIADSGAGMHMSFRKDFFSVLQTNQRGHMVKIADDRTIPAAGIGTVKIREELEGVVYERELQDVLYVPELKCSLFSIGSVNKKGYSFHSFENGCEIRDHNGELAARGIPHGPLFRMCFKVRVPVECNTAKLADNQGKLKLWHERMGHVNVRAVKHTCELLDCGTVESENVVNRFFCEGCVMGKQSRRPHPSIRVESNYGPGEKIHTDVCGPVNISSPSNTRFFLLFKDENTSYRKVYFLRHKSEVFNRFKEFEAFVSTQTGKKIKVLRSDNGTEYTCSQLRTFLGEKGIIHEFSSPYIHEQNGRAESEIRTLVESARAMIYAKNVDKKLWKKAMDEEILALEENQTWSLCALPQGKRAIGCRWVFSIKHDTTGNLERYKARLVAKGFRQREGIDYFETFAPVVRYESIRIFLAIAAKEDYEIMKFDVKTAFLYGDLQEEIYLEQPPGYINESQPDAVFKLHRSLYGLKQSPRCWNEKFTRFLNEFNLVNIESDKCVFIGVVEGSKVYLALYVDDGLIMSKSESAIKYVLDYLENNFKITVGCADEFLGFEIKRNRECRQLKICQSGYIKRTLGKFNMLEANPANVPAEPGMFLQKQTPKLDHKIPYREAIGSLLFAARVCRPDIEFAVNYASQFLNCYDDSHWQVVKRILRYLKGTRDYGIIYGNSGSLPAFSGFTDIRNKWEC